MNAIGYTRVSSEQQVREGLSLSTQTERLNAWATMKGISLGKIVSDEGISGGTMDRPGLNNILKDLESIDGLVITQLDRLTRSVRDLGQLLELFHQHDVSLVSLSEGVDATSAGGRLFLNVLGSVSQWQREDISEKTTVVLRSKRSRGEHVGRIPFGFQMGVDGRLERDPDQIEQIRRMKRLKQRGWSYRRIANRFGFSTGLVYTLVTTDLRTTIARNAGAAVRS